MDRDAAAVPVAVHDHVPTILPDWALMPSVDTVFGRASWTSASLPLVHSIEGVEISIDDGEVDD